MLFSIKRAVHQRVKLMKGGTDS